MRTDTLRKSGCIKVGQEGDILPVVPEQISLGNVDPEMARYEAPFRPELTAFLIYTIMIIKRPDASVSNEHFSRPSVAITGFQRISLCLGTSLCIDQCQGHPDVFPPMRQIFYREMQFHKLVGLLFKSIRTKIRDEGRRTK